MTDSNSTLNLKPCPFCGSEVELVKSYTVDGTDWIRHKGQTCGFDVTGFDVDDLPTAWNTRVPQINTSDDDDVMSLKDALISARGVLIENGFPDLPFLCDGIQNAINKLRQPTKAPDGEGGVIITYTDSNGKPCDAPVKASENKAGTITCLEADELIYGSQTKAINTSDNFICSNCGKPGSRQNMISVASAWWHKECLHPYPSKAANSAKVSGNIDTKSPVSIHDEGQCIQSMGEGTSRAKDCPTALPATSPTQTLNQEMESLAIGKERSEFHRGWAAATEFHIAMIKKHSLSSDIPLLPDEVKELSAMKRESVDLMKGAEAIHQCHYHPVDWGSKEWRAMFEREKRLALAMADACATAWGLKSNANDFINTEIEGEKP